MDWGGVAVKGKLLDIQGQPVSDAHVYAYGEGRSNTLGPADAMSEPTVENGVYEIILPGGVYTLVARRRLSGSISGPMKNGDLYGQLSEPFHATRNDRQDVDITMRTFRQGTEGDPQRILTTNTRILGTVVDDEGAAFSGANVFAYRGSFRPDPPDHLAPPTDTKGRFEISLPGGGLYTIGARTGLGGKPGTDDSIGFWGGKDQPREIKGGTVTKGVRIVLRPYGAAGKDNSVSE